MSCKYSEMELFSDAALRLKNLICPTAHPNGTHRRPVHLERLSLRVGGSHWLRRMSMALRLDQLEQFRLCLQPPSR